MGKVHGYGNRTKEIRNKPEPIKIDLWELWEREWNNAYRFYHTKGNAQTKSRLKTKWHNDFMEMITDVAKRTK